MVVDDDLNSEKMLKVEEGPSTKRGGRVTMYLGPEQTVNHHHYPRHDYICLILAIIRLEILCNVDGPLIIRRTRRRAPK